MTNQERKKIKERSREILIECLIGLDWDGSDFELVKKRKKRRRVVCLLDIGTG